MADLAFSLNFRIYENQHLLDATEIFRKLNVHKKVSQPLFTTRPIRIPY